MTHRTGQPSVDATPGIAGRLRDQFPVAAERAYLFSGGLAPASAPVTAAIEDWLRQWALEPSYLWDHLTSETDAVRERLARLFGSSPGSIAIVDGTSRASNIAVALLPTPPESNVVFDATTYPSSLYPWMLPERSHVELRRAASGRAGLAASPSDIARLVDRRTIAVTVTHVDPNSGVRHDLRPIADIAHAHGAILIVDVAQSAGVIPVDPVADGIDVAVGTAMKWLLGPPGIGYLFVAPSLLARSGAPQVGYFGADLLIGDRPQLQLSSDARRHELGVPNVMGMPGFRAGLDLILETGVDEIAAHVEMLVSRCIAGLRDLGLRVTTPVERGLRAGLVVVAAQNPLRLRDFLRDHDVDVWGWEPGGFVRADFHLFNNDGDVDRFSRGLEEYLRANGPSSIQPRDRTF